MERAPRERLSERRVAPERPTWVLLQLAAAAAVAVVADVVTIT